MKLEKLTFLVKTLNKEYAGIFYRPALKLKKYMPMYEATVRTPNGEEKKRVYADTPQEAKRLLEQLHGGPRAVPYIPHVVPS